MGQTLTHGVYLPDEGERNCYNGLASNWQLLDSSVGTIAEHTTALAGKAPAVHTHTKSDVTDLLNSNFIPSANNSYDLGSSSYQWNNVYSKNYYYNGTAWGLDKNNTWSVAQFCSQNTIHVRNVNPGVAPSSDISAGMKFENANATYAFTDIVGKVFKSGTTFVNLIASNKFTNGALDPNGTTVSKNLQIGVISNGEGFIYTECGWRNNLQPNASESGVYSLGTSTNKWKTFNGLNPGALSLPKIVAKTSADISSAIVGADGETQYLDGTDNNYTAALDGWISMCIGGFTQSNELWITVYDQKNETWGTSAESSTSARNNLFIIFPIRANQKMRIRMKCTAVTYARFYPCEGNV